MSGEEMRDAAMTRRLLVVANEAVASETLRELIGADARSETDVLVIAPALNTRIGFWAGDDRRARRHAEERLTFCLRSLAAAGIDAEGFVADADPLLAIEDALQQFDADRIVISTHADGRSNWLARNILDRARHRFAQPVERLRAA
jgi:hypothetical protein